MEGFAFRWQNSRARHQRGNVGGCDSSFNTRLVVWIENTTNPATSADVNYMGRRV
jgi:hypothetical protein